MKTVSNTNAGWSKPTASYLSITFGPRDVPVRMLAIKGLLHASARFDWPTHGSEANRPTAHLKVVR